MTPMRISAITKKTRPNRAMGVECRLTSIRPEKSAKQDFRLAPCSTCHERCAEVARALALFSTADKAQSVKEFLVKKFTARCARV